MDGRWKDGHVTGDAVVVLTEQVARAELEGADPAERQRRHREVLRELDQEDAERRDGRHLQ